MVDIKIGIVENDRGFTEQLSEQLMKWSEGHLVFSHIEKFNSAESFLVRHFLKFDIVFLDIMLDQKNGMELANEMRLAGYNGEIVFLTSFREYVFQGYEVHALNYLLKPADYEKICACMDYILNHLTDTHYIFGSKERVEKIPYYSILFFSSNNHYTTITMLENERTRVLDQRVQLKSIEHTLPSQFKRCHRTAIINMDHVRKLEGKNAIFIHHIKIPISNTYIDQIRTAFIQQIYKHGI